MRGVRDECRNEGETAFETTNRHTFFVFVEEELAEILEVFDIRLEGVLFDW